MADDREVYFASEAFLIGVLQVVSGAALIASLTESSAITDAAGGLPHLMFLTLMGLALVAAVLAAFASFRYKMWNMKAGASAAKHEVEEAKERLRKANWHLDLARWEMLFGTASIAVAIVFLVGGIWFYTLCRPA